MAIYAEHPEFVPHPVLKNGHLMTIAPSVLPRRFSKLLQAAKRRLFEVEAGTKVLTYCHWQPDPQSCPTIVMLHGLIGSSESASVLGATQKAFASGMNVVRVNMRNCGGTMHLTPTLYDSGMSADSRAIVAELVNKDKLANVFLVGWSMGGNLVLKAAGEMAAKGPDLLRGVCAVSPAMDLPACIKSLEKNINRIYERRFIAQLKHMLKQKVKLFPGLYDLSALDKVQRMRDFDENFTARYGGYGSAENYYKNASALPVVRHISVPTLILQAQDDPIIPFASFKSPLLDNPHITLVTPKHGGHVGFIQKDPEILPHLDRYWAENRVVEFCQQVMKNLNGTAALRDY